MSISPLATTRPPLTRLTFVELRKMSDTRAGFWLRIGIGLLTVVVVTVIGIADSDSDHALDDLLSAAVTPATVLLPVVGILLVTSEYSQRTTLITFTVVPQRLRVLIAKLFAGMLGVPVTLAVALLVALAGTAVFGGEWQLSAGLLGQTGVELVTAMAIGIAFGTVIQSSAPAIVLYFALPIAFGALGTLDALDDVARWLDTSRTLEPLSDHLFSGREWARAGVSLALWFVLPLAIGIWRVTHEDIQ